MTRKSTVNPPSDIQRQLDRHKQVVEAIAGQPVFHLDQINRLCPHEPAGFVTRIVNELENHGWLLREGSHRKTATYKWNPGRGFFSLDHWLDEQFGSQIPCSPPEDRPRERLLHHGADKLRTSELLAILIRAGRRGESAVSAGEKVSRQYQHRLAELPDAGRGELKGISSAVGPTAYCQIMAGVELGRRVAAATADSITHKIASSAQAIEFCSTFFSRLAHDAKQEEFHIVTLDTKNQVIDTHQITVGTLDASLVHPREVFRPAIKDAASSIILLHNHPSGDPTPSPEDLQVTSRLENAGETLGIQVLDHIVLGTQQCISIRESQNLS